MVFLFFRVKSIKKLIKKDAEKTKERQEKKQNKLIEASSKPQRLGRQKYPLSIKSTLNSLWMLSQLGCKLFLSSYSEW
jgi:hypothetical protein